MVQNKATAQNNGLRSTYMLEPDQPAFLLMD